MTNTRGPHNRTTCICRSCGAFVPKFRSAVGTFDPDDGTVICEECR